MAKGITLNNTTPGSSLNITHKEGLGAVNLTSEDLSKLKSVDTIAKLRLLIEAQPTVWVSGYHDKDDGAFGSNVFRWNALSTEADNGGTIIKLDSVATGRYELQYDGAVNVKWFGADSAVIDNLTAFTNCMQYCNNKVKMYSNGDTYVISDTLYLPINTDYDNGLMWEHDNTIIECSNLSAQAVLSTVISTAFKVGYDFKGRLNLRYSTYSTTGIGFNMGNMHHCAFDKILVLNANTGFYTKSIFSTTWDYFYIQNCNIGVNMNPLGAGSAGGGCTSLKGSIWNSGVVKGAILENVVYSKISFYAESVEISSPYNIAGELPIAFHLKGSGSGNEYNVGIENFQGCLFRVEGENHYDNVTFNNSLLPANEWLMSTSYTNIPQAENGFFSIQGGNCIEFSTLAFGVSSLPNQFMVMVYLGTDSRLIHKSGYLYKDPSQTSVVVIGNNPTGYIPIGVRLTNFNAGNSVPMVGYSMQKVRVASTGATSYSLNWEQPFSFAPLFVSTEILTDQSVGQSTIYPQINTATTTGVTIKSNMPSGYWFEVIAFGMLA